MLHTRKRSLSTTQFMENGLLEIEIDPTPLQTHIPTIVEGMRRLCNSKKAQKLFPYTVLRLDAMGWEEDAGFYSERTDETKDYFHYSPDSQWALTDSFAREFIPFLEACDALTRYAQSHVMRLVRDIDREYGTTFLEYFTDTYVVMRVLRYLKIFDHIKEDAFPHFDRCGITNHLWASHPGLFVYSNGVPRRVDECAHNRAALFPGKKLLAHTEGKFGIHGMHGVRDARKTSVGDERIAVVVFTHCRLPPRALQWLTENDVRIKEIARSHTL